MTTIVDVTACEVLDSRGRPTVSARVTVAPGVSGTATVPSGASVGTFEASELRDGGHRYRGWGVRRAVRNVIDILGPAVRGLDAGDQAEVDATLRATDGTENLGRLGANAVLAVSLATSMAAAMASGQPLHVALASTAGVEPVVPMPMVNIISGGAHAARYVDVQDFLVIPMRARDIAEALEIAVAVRAGTADAARDQGLAVALVADEGGLAVRVPTNEAVLDLLSAGIDRAGARGDAAIALDVAAHQLAVRGGYRLATEGRIVTTGEWIDTLVQWVASYPIVSIEDPLDEDDWAGWELLARRLGTTTQILGDDLFATNPQRLRCGIDRGAANAILVKPNQIGTLSEAAAVTRLARSAGYATVASARSGDTEDSWLADLATGWATGQIKVGSTMRAERTAKWNRLIWIAHELGPSARFAGGSALARN